MKKYKLYDLMSYHYCTENPKWDKNATMEDLDELCAEFEVEKTSNLGYFLMEESPAHPVYETQGFVLGTYGSLKYKINEYRHYLDMLAIDPREFDAMQRWMKENGYEFMEGHDYIVWKREQLHKPKTVTQYQHGMGTWEEWDDGIRTTYEGYADDFYTEVYLKRDELEKEKKKK